MTATLERPPDRTVSHAGARASTRTGRASPNRRTLRLYLVDALVAVAVVLLLDVPLTGLAIHEWLGLAVGVGLTTHLVQHAGWILSTTRRLLRNSVRNRINYVMMFVLFATFLTAAWSGIMISQVAVPALGIGTAGSPFWTWLHLVSVQIVVWITALHVALNWKWIVATTSRFSGNLRRRMTGDSA